VAPGARSCPLPRSWPLIQPTAAFFTATRGSDHDTAQVVLDDVLRHLHMETRAFKLDLLPEIADEYAHSYQSMGAVAGLEDQLPGRAAAHEPATDLHCIITGFGLFQHQDAADMGGADTRPTRAQSVSRKT